MSTELGSNLSIPSVEENDVVTTSQTGNVRPEKSTDSDRQLQLIRRIDWRFLLPVPELETVAYIGPADGMLLHSLKTFSKSVCVLESEIAIQECRSTFDIVVTRNPSKKTLQQTVHLLRPQGMLYIEHDRQLKTFQSNYDTTEQFRIFRSRFKTPHDYVTHLETLGFDNIQKHWHQPDFEACTVIVPLEDATALRHFLATRKPGVRGKLLSLAIVSSFQFGLLQRMIRCFSILAQRKGEL